MTDVNKVQEPILTLIAFMSPLPLLSFMHPLYSPAPFFPEQYGDPPPFWNISENLNSPLFNVGGGTNMNNIYRV